MICPGQFPKLEKLSALVLQPASSAKDAKAKLRQLEEELRCIDLEVAGGFTAVADIVHLYSTTQKWFTAERGYKVGPTFVPWLGFMDLLFKAKCQKP